jgi:CheY-like chemotaxis protein
MRRLSSIAKISSSSSRNKQPKQTTTKTSRTNHQATSHVAPAVAFHSIIDMSSTKPIPNGRLHSVEAVCRAKSHGTDSLLVSSQQASAHRGGVPNHNHHRHLRKTTSSDGADPRTRSHAGLTANDQLQMPRRCLIVDDDAVVRTMLKRQVQVCFPAWHVETVSSGEAALALMKPKAAGGQGKSFDVCFVDQYMPGPDNPMTGDQVIGAMRSLSMAGYRIGCSGNNVQDLHMSAGADGFLRKPFSMELLRAVAKHVFELPPVHSCVVIGHAPQVKRCLASVLSAQCIIQEAECVDAAVTMVHSAAGQQQQQGQQRGGDGGTSNICGGIDLIIVDYEQVFAGAGTVASELATRLRRQICPAAKVVILMSSESRDQAVPSGFDVMWPRALESASAMHAHLMRILLPSGGASDPTPEGEDSAATGDDDVFDDVFDDDDVDSSSSSGGGGEHPNPTAIAIAE